MKSCCHKLPECCHSILDSLDEGIVTLDLNFRISSFNRKAEQITGVCAQEALGRLYDDVLGVHTSRMNEMLIAALDKKRPTFQEQVFFRRPDTRCVVINVNTDVLRDTHSRIIGAVQIFKEQPGLYAKGCINDTGQLFENMVSRNQKMLDIFGNLKSIAISDCTLLIEGATGTGKEMIARAVHNNSSQKNGPFVPVNCGAIPDTLIESELFGYKAGAFTGARTDKPGRFEWARNGTIFLDEIGDISAALQIRLLRVLECKVYEPLGAVRSKDTNARVVVASHRNLDRMVAENKFREDLYFRINVMKLYLPKLAERKEDIPLLVDHFIDRFNEEKDKSIKGLTPTALAVLMGYEWPGNVRELENAIEHAYVLCRGDKMIDLPHLPNRIFPNDCATDKNYNLTLKQIEKNAILQTLQKNDWRKMKTARELGINKNTLRRKIVAYGIQQEIRRKSNVNDTHPDAGKRQLNRSAAERYPAI